MKPHSQHAPGLGRTNDIIGALAKKHRKYVEQERAEQDRRDREAVA